MSIIYTSTTSPKPEDITPELEQEMTLEETLPEEYTHESQEQDQDQGSGSDSDSGSGSDASAGEVEKVDSSTNEETTTIPETFFSAMAYSIEAYLAAIDAQQDAALMNIDLYVSQVQQQHETSKSLSQIVRERFRADAKKMFADAAMSFTSAFISMGQNYFGQQNTLKNSAELSTTITQRDTLQANYSAIRQGPLGRGTMSTRSAIDPVVTARAQAATKKPAGGVNGADRANGLNAKQTADYSRLIKDDINAAETKISGIRQDNQMGHTIAQVYGELFKSFAQAGASVAKGMFDLEIAKLEHQKVMYENVKDLISSLVQQIQGRVSTSSKGMLDGIDTLRNAIRQFQG